MAVVVEINEKGILGYASIRGSEGISNEEKKKAIKLNDLTKKEISKFKIKKSKNQKNKLRNKVGLYWDFGFMLGKIFETGLVLPGEKKLYWKNVRLHAPKELLAKDRGPNRIHIAYCFRLAGYPKKIALKREWSEWVYLFDSPFINGESRFDEWDKNKIGSEKNYVSRKSTRLFIQCLNSILGNIETKDLNNNELLECYEGAWQLSKNLVGNKKFNTTNDFKSKLKKSIHEKNNLIGQLMDRKISAKEFARAILNKI